MQRRIYVSVTRRAVPAGLVVAAAFADGSGSVSAAFYAFLALVAVVVAVLALNAYGELVEAPAEPGEDQTTRRLQALLWAVLLGVRRARHGRARSGARPGRGSARRIDGSHRLPARPLHGRDRGARCRVAAEAAGRPWLRTGTTATKPRPWRCRSAAVPRRSEPTVTTRQPSDGRAERAAPRGGEPPAGASCSSARGPHVHRADDSEVVVEADRGRERLRRSTSHTQPRSYAAEKA